MLFHVTFEILEEIVLPEAKTMRNEWLGPQLQKVMESGKVREAGLLSASEAASSWWTLTIRRSSLRCSARSCTTPLG